MSHLVPEAWHETETRHFLRRIFESPQDSRVAGDFTTYVRFGVPYFLPSIAQYSLERTASLWLATFYGKPHQKHVGGFIGEDGPEQVYSIDPDYIEISAVKLPVNVKESNVSREAIRELRKTQCYSRGQTKEANVFRFSENGNLTQRLYVDGTAVNEAFLVANFFMDGDEFFGRAPDELFHLHHIPKFDPAKPEAAYYSNEGGVAFISPVTMLPE